MARKKLKENQVEDEVTLVRGMELSMSEYGTICNLNQGKLDI